MDDGRQCHGDEFADLLAEKLKQFNYEPLIGMKLDEGKIIAILDEKDEEIDRLRAENEKLRALLREVEWCGGKIRQTIYNTNGLDIKKMCPICFAEHKFAQVDPEAKHKPDCRLKAAIGGE